MQAIEILGINLQLLPQKAIYLPQHRSLLVSDVHLGKSETFQQAGIPIPNLVNRTTLEQLQTLCRQVEPETLLILGDLFHSRAGMVEEVITLWQEFIQATGVRAQLILGNHDRPLLSTLQRMAIDCIPESLSLESLILSHDPAIQPGHLNICGHVHPCLRIRNRLDNLRLPCFFFDRSQNSLILPSFGEFTGSYEVTITADTIAYVIVDDTVVPWEGR